jgi:hypothetical protein
MTQEELKEIEQVFGKQAKEQIVSEITKAEDRINQKYADVVGGLMSTKAFEDFKKEAMDPVNASLSRIESVQKEQGIKLAAQIEKSAPNSRTLEDFVINDIVPEMKKIKSEGKGYIEITGKQLKDAGITSIGGSIQDMTSPPGSPYAPGLGGETLTIFDIARNPNFITSKVNLGRTSQSRLAWANETDYIGSPARVAEGGLKPLTQHKFQVETSTAKKIAGWVELTDEFDQDLPQFGTAVRRMLNNDVIRAWDDAIQSAVIAAARPYEIIGLDDDITSANYWDAALAMLAQVGYYNFTPNTLAINWLTNVVMKTLKATGTGMDGQYLIPPFVAELSAYLVYANKVANKYALGGDLKQFNVDIYKDFVLKYGFINDEFIYNKFAIVGEIRYHDYISDSRKKALVYDSLGRVAGQINGSANFS